MNHEKKADGSIQINEVFIYLCVADPEAAINFYAEVFGAEELFRLTGPEEGIAHAEIKVGPAVILIAGEYPDHNIRSPEYYGGTGIRIHLHVDDVDRLAERAQKGGAKILMEQCEQPHGERQCRISDTVGHEWLLGNGVEDVSPKELQRRLNNSFDDESNL